MRAGSGGGVRRGLSAWVRPECKAVPTPTSGLPGQQAWQEHQRERSGRRSAMKSLILARGTGLCGGNGVSPTRSKACGRPSPTTTAISAMCRSRPAAPSSAAFWSRRSTDRVPRSKARMSASRLSGTWCHGRWNLRWRQGLGTGPRQDLQVEDEAVGQHARRVGLRPWRDLPRFELGAGEVAASRRPTSRCGGRASLPPQCRAGNCPVR